MIRKPCIDCGVKLFPRKHIVPSLVLPGTFQCLVTCQLITNSIIRHLFICMIGFFKFLTIFVENSTSPSTHLHSLVILCIPYFTTTFILWSLAQGSAALQKGELHVHFLAWHNYNKIITIHNYLCQ